MRADLSRRAFGALVTAAGVAYARASAGRARTLPGGKISLRVPWPTSALDPHRLDDGLAAIFGDALFDTLYAHDGAGGFVPSLAEAEPEIEGTTLRVALRAGLRTGRGRPLDARAAAASIARARGAGARAWLADVPAPRIEGRWLIFAMKDAGRLMRALASPLVAIVRADFSPESPDGTGPFRLGSRGGSLVLARNPFAARGPAFLEEITLGSARNLDASLVAFERAQDDIGWLGSGLYSTRPGSRAFDVGPVAHAVLATGQDVTPWNAPGAAQAACDSVPTQKLSSLAVGPAWRSTADDGWGGPPATLLVRDDSPWLMELARTLAAVLSRPAHEIVAKPVGPAEIAQRRASRSYPLLLDVVRPLLHGALGAAVALATADDPTRAADLVRHPPKNDLSPRAVARSLRLGIVGEVRVQGGQMPDLTLVPSTSTHGVDWGACHTRSR